MRSGTLPASARCGALGLTEFLDSAASASLITHGENTIALADKLVAEHAFDAVRLENPIEVYANEAAPLAAVSKAVGRALARVDGLAGPELGAELFDDEVKALAWDKAAYAKPRHDEINQRETATADPSPFLLVPAQPRRLGVVLTHGFLASPAEVRAFGAKLEAEGYVTVGVRLKGHGTSPWDLRDRSWRDWLASVSRGRRIAAGFVERYVLVGFSTGGNLSLISACDHPAAVAGVVAVCPPLKFRNRNMRFVPLMHGANRIVRWLSSYEGVMPFRPNESEHPHINYRHMPCGPLRADASRRASQSSVAPGRDTDLSDPGARRPCGRSAEAVIAHERLGAAWKALHWIESARHGILNEDIGETHAFILDFLARVEREEALTGSPPAA